MAQEAVYSQDRRDGLTDTIASMNAALNVIWESEDVAHWPTVCPDGIAPTSKEGPAVGRALQEIGFSPAELFDEPDPADQSAQGKGRGGRPQWARQHG